MNDSDRITGELREALSNRLADLAFTLKQVAALRLEASVRIAYTASLEAELVTASAKVAQYENELANLKLKYANDLHSAHVEAAEAIQTTQSEIEHLVMRAAALGGR